MKKENQILQQNLMFIPNLHAKRFAEPGSPEYNRKGDFYVRQK
jgi:hypothetical protein